ncbi:MAG: hypothetical protein QY322_02085 [bacterium]|nr:MAG: hypothetical protein QY322_02085 [bacterium]
MSNITNIEKLKLERILEMGGGYVLDLSNQKLQEFVHSAIKIDIWSDKYSYASGSKANRLRSLWEQEPNHIVGKLIADLLEYWKTKRLIDGVVITSNDQSLFDECQKIVIRLVGGQPPKQSDQVSSEDEFINKEFKSVSLEKLGLDTTITDTLSQRIEEIRKCLSSKSSLATIFLCGSTLEGILLGTASKYARKFNQSKCAPQKEGKVLPFHNWTLSNFIDTASDLKILGDDVKKHSHALRDFRNYIHPYQQVASGFSPHEHTAKISWQVLQAAIFEIGNYKDS